MSSQMPTNDAYYYPSEIHRLLKLGGNLIVPQAAKQEPEPAPLDLPVDLPVEPLEIVSDVPEVVHDTHHVEEVRVESVYEPLYVEEQPQTRRFKFMSSGIVVYPVIFIVAFIFFYSALNFSSLISQVSGWFARPEDEQILGEDLTEYYSWMNGYYFAIGYRESLEPFADIDKDGLSNMDEFVIRTNPTMADSDGDGISDGIEIINSSNFWGDGGMTEKQSKLASQLDVIKISNRISFNVATNSAIKDEQVLGKTTISYDTQREGRLSIPRLGIQVPIIWSQDPNSFESDLTKGVVHYPGTAMPGETGTVYISGHSSDYPWKRHPYKQIFAKINALEAGDDVFVDIYGADGKLYNYRYRVSMENVYKPDDQTQFIDNSAAKLNLSTCWPIGTAKDRYVVTAILEGV